MNTIKETMQDLMDIIKRSKNSDMEQEYKNSQRLLLLAEQHQDTYAQPVPSRCNFMPVFV